MGERGREMITLNKIFHTVGLLAGNYMMSVAIMEKDERKFRIALWVLILSLQCLGIAGVLTVEKGQKSDK